MLDSFSAKVWLVFATASLATWCDLSIFVLGGGGIVNHLVTFFLLLIRNTFQRKGKACQGLVSCMSTLRCGPQSKLHFKSCGMVLLRSKAQKLPSRNCGWFETTTTTARAHGFLLSLFTMFIHILYWTHCWHPWCYPETHLTLGVETVAAFVPKPLGACPWRKLHKYAHFWSILFFTCQFLCLTAEVCNRHKFITVCFGSRPRTGFSRFIAVPKCRSAAPRLEQHLRRTSHHCYIT